MFNFMKLDLKRRALFLSYFTVGYNIIEGIIAVGLGIITNSTALIGFGSDSFIESLSGSVMIWRFNKKFKSAEEEERIEKRAQKLVSYTFFILGTYVLYESVKDLILREPPEPSLFGIIIAVLSLIIMPALTYLKYQTGKKLKSKSLVSDSMQTLVCVLMSGALLIGLGLNYLFGIWWLDPIVGLLFVYLLYKEGYEAYKGED
jgi:cation diffusion facilitator family transporter